MSIEMDFVQGSTRRRLLAMALPMLAAMFLNMMYNLVDSLWIGNLLGEMAYAALTNSTSVVLLLTAAAMGASNGISILLSQAIGAGDKVKIKSLLTTSFLLIVLLAFGTTAALEIFLPIILGALHTPLETYDLAYRYLAIYVLGYPAVCLYLYFTAVLRSYGDAVFQAAAMLVCTLFNALLDPIFIHLMGFQGAALATLLAQTICLFVSIVYLKHKKLFVFQIASFDKKAVMPLVQKAVPSILQQSIPAVSTAFLTAIVSAFGITAIAAYGIAGKLETLLFYPAMALNMVLTTIVGQCIGGWRPDRAKDYLRCALGYGGGLLLLLSAAVIFFAQQLSGLFVRSPQVAELVSSYFLIVGAGYVLNMVINCFLGLLNGLGSPARSMLLMIVYYILVRMPLAYLFVQWGGGLKGIWAAVLISHIVAAISAVLMGSALLKRALDQQGKA